MPQPNKQHRMMEQLDNLPPAARQMTVAGQILAQNSIEEHPIDPIDVTSFFSGEKLIYDDESTLPPGLILEPVSGVISGTIASDASSAAPYPVEITAIDNNGDTVTIEFTWEIAKNLASDSSTEFSTNVAQGKSGNRFTGQREFVLSERISSFSEEPLLAGRAKPGTVLVGRIYAEDGSVLGEIQDEANQAGNWVLCFAGISTTQNAKVIVEHAATEQVALGRTEFELGPHALRTLQFNPIHKKFLLSGPTISSSGRQDLNDLHEENINPLHLLEP